MAEAWQNDQSVGKAPADFTAHQLMVFRAVARQLNYTRAAEQLYLSQPAVTQQIRNLERIIGLRLFARKGRGIVLTPAGQEFLEHAERILALLHETEPVVREISTLERGSVVVGASTSAGTYIVPPLLGHFHARYPKVHITLIVANRRSIEERLISHQIDLAIISIVEHQERFLVELLQPYELVVVASPDHRLARRTGLTAYELQEEMFLLREEGAGTRQDTEQHFSQVNIPLRSYLELDSIEAIKEGAVAGLGIAVLSRESVETEIASGDLLILDVQGFPSMREWHIVTLKNRKMSYAATAFRQFLLQKGQMPGSS